MAVLRLLAKRNLDLGRARNRTACRLHALLCDLVPGGITKEMSVQKAQRLLATARPGTAVETTRMALAYELVDDPRAAR